MGFPFKPYRVMYKILDLWGLGGKIFWADFLFHSLSGFVVG